MDTKIFEARVLEPTTQKFIDGLASQGGKPIYELSISDAREVLEGIQRQPVQKLPAQEEDITVPGGPNGKISIRIIRPANSTGRLPVVIYIFTAAAGYWGAKTPAAVWFARSLMEWALLSCL
jgi:hypothetical protein